MTTTKKTWDQMLADDSAIKTLVPGIEDAPGGGFYGLVHVTRGNGNRHVVRVCNAHLGRDSTFETAGQVAKFSRDGDALNAGLALFHLIEKTGDVNTMDRINWEPLSV